MASDQTPRQVIAEALESKADPWVARDIDLALDAAGFAIVRKPTEDQVTAACRAYEIEMDTGEAAGWFRRSMAAAIAAASAAGKDSDDG